MSYRAFKRLLGETSLERKCRFLFGAGILVLITLSFWLYAYLTEQLAYNQAVTTCRLLVFPILAQHHVPYLRRQDRAAARGRGTVQGTQLAEQRRDRKGKAQVHLRIPQRGQDREEIRNDLTNATCARSSARRHGEARGVQAQAQRKGPGLLRPDPGRQVVPAPATSTATRERIPGHGPHSHSRRRPSRKACTGIGPCSWPPPSAPPCSS